MLGTVGAAASAKSENAALFMVNHCTDITPLLQRLLEWCSIVRRLNVSVSELPPEMSCGGGNRGRGRGGLGSAGAGLQTQAASARRAHPSRVRGARSVALGWKLSRFPSFAEFLHNAALLAPACCGK